MELLSIALFITDTLMGLAKSPEKIFRNDKGLRSIHTAERIQSRPKGQDPGSGDCDQSFPRSENRDHPLVSAKHVHNTRVPLELTKSAAMVHHGIKATSKYGQFGDVVIRHMN